MLKNIDCGYSLEPPRQVPRIYVLSRNMKYMGVFLSENLLFLEVKYSIYFNKLVFVMIPFFLLLWGANFLLLEKTHLVK